MGILIYPGEIKTFLLNLFNTIGSGILSRRILLFLTALPGQPTIHHADKEIIKKRKNRLFLIELYLAL
jgi:hypothetical protein